MGLTWRSFETWRQVGGAFPFLFYTSPREHLGALWMGRGDGGWGLSFELSGVDMRRLRSSLLRLGMPSMRGLELS